MSVLAAGSSFEPANVVVQPGGKPVIGKFIQTVMEPGDEVLYPNPGYPIYESQIEYFGGTAVPYRYIETRPASRLDLEYLAAHITPRTDGDHLQRPAEPAVGGEQRRGDAGRRRAGHRARPVGAHRRGVLRDALLGHQHARSPSLPGMHERTVILYTFSKKFAMTGLAPRCGDRSGAGRRA